MKPILLVEDDHRDLEFMMIALERCQLANQVIIVRDGAEALDYLHRRGIFASRLPGNPAVVVLDLQLPKVNGLEVLEQMQKSDNLKYIPTVMLTTSTEEPDVRNAYQLGVNAYVVKPMSFGDFVRAIRVLGFFGQLITNFLRASVMEKITLTIYKNIICI
ncbi:response regulator (plasmid) [Pseudomonas sp. HR96]|uniref:response regulator n=1 Tax=Pseudomonas sp. HR96 TaxID=1027966 RepID=UPI002A7650B6|nr:response regulator [Pseudomonas sp. HR96]WPP02400.1 response regulator [Pseudomonas sp. HR96]